MKFNKQKRGVTLIESIMVIGLLTIIAFGIGSFIVTSMRAWLMVSGREAVLTKARVAMDRMVAELRRIRKPQNILVYTTSEVQFLDLSLNDIDFKQNGTNLLRNSDILATGLATPEGLRFTYLDATGEVTSVKQNIRSIRVWLYLSSQDQSITLESSARIRNL